MRGLDLTYVVTQDECRAELYIDRGKDSEEENKSIYDQLYQVHEGIEKAIAFPISWERLDGRRASRIRISLPGGYRSPEEEWDRIQGPLIKAMNQLDQALKPHLKGLKLRD